MALHNNVLHSTNTNNKITSKPNLKHPTDIGEFLKRPSTPHRPRPSPRTHTPTVIISRIPNPSPLHPLTCRRRNRPPSRHPSPRTRPSPTPIPTLLMLLRPLPNPPPLRNPHRTPPAQSVQVARSMARSRTHRPRRSWRRLTLLNPFTTTTTTSDPLIRRRRHQQRRPIITQHDLRSSREVRLVHFQHGTGREVQETFEESVVFFGEPGWLAVWAAGDGACAGGHCWAVLC